MEQAQTHFELFGLPLNFDIDLQDLAQRYREMQRAVHPDRFASAADHERRLSMEKAALINDAYQILKSPQRRARYMLELQSVSFDDEKDTTLDPEFLMEQIELREALNELDGSDDAVSRLNSIMQDIQQRISAVLQQLSTLLTNTELDDEQKATARKLVHQLQFLNKLQQEAEYQEEKLMDAL